MTLLDEVDALIDRDHLLGHPFYTKWVAGTLPIETIRDYATQYFAFESNFPRFLSAIHARCEDPEVRQTILRNLWDEEHGGENHRELWLRFAEGLGVRREDVEGATPRPATAALVDTYHEACTEAAAGLGAIHAYERQVPAVADAKIRGLRDHYGVMEQRTVAFWEVHRGLDVEHADAERAHLAAMEPESVLAGTRAALDAWWRFLDSVDVAES